MSSKGEALTSHCANPVVSSLMSKLEVTSCESMKKERHTKIMHMQYLCVHHSQPSFSIPLKMKQLEVKFLLQCFLLNITSQSGQLII